MTIEAHSARPNGQPTPTRRRPLRQSPALRRVASLKLAVLLMVTIGVVLAIATVYEARHSRAEAQSLFYQSWWFCLLLVALAVNIFAATLVRWPFPLRRIGFPITHLGILVILAGAVTTNRIGLEGQLRIVERETADRISLPGLVVRIEAAGSATHAPVDIDLPMDASRPTRGIDTTADVADLGLRLGFAEFLPNSRWQHVTDAHGARWVAVAAPADTNAEPIPALKVNASIARVEESLWLGWERPATIELAGRSFTLTLRNDERKLPFALRLDRFERETYPGTMQAAMFSSHVTLCGPDISTPPSVIISMNRPLRLEGYTFFQSGFHSDGARTTSILTVSRDPGKPLVYTGFVLVCIGVVLMVAARIRSRSRPIADVASAATRSITREVSMPCAA